jgi:outer membrane lipoprotein-sorting protein
MQYLFLWAGLLATSAVASEPTIEELLDATDDIQRGNSSRAVIEMQVKTSRYERTMKMEALSEGEEKSRIRVLSPAKDAGVTTLMVDDNIWNYLPKVDRTMKIPGAMMSGAWMGSHFSNDDLVKSSRLNDEFDGAITARPSDADSEQYVVELTSKPDAAVVWGKVVVRVSDALMPESIEYYDEDARLVRTLTFGEIRTIGGRNIPMEITLTPHAKEGEYTKIVYEELEFDVKTTDRDFSLQALKGMGATP